MTIALTKNRRRFSAVVFISSLVCLFLVLMTLFPVIWTFLGSFKGEREVYKANPIRFFPSVWRFDNYNKLFTNPNAPFLQSMLATGGVAAFGAFFSIFLNSMAAFSFARFNFRFRSALWYITLFNMFIPNIAILVSSYALCADLGMMNTFWVLAIPAIGNGGQIFFFRQFFLNMPRSLEEAARVDGASKFMIYLRIFLPNAKGPLVLQGVGSFLGWWNSYMWPSLTVTSESLRQVMQVIRSYSSMYKTSFGVVLAGSFVAAVVPIALFICFQKNLVKGMIISGIK